MARISSRQLPWLLLASWSFLFALVVFSAFSQDGASLSSRFGIVFFWGFILSSIMVLLLVRKNEAPISAGFDEERGDSKETPINWQAAEERNAWLEISAGMKPTVELQSFLQGAGVHLRALFANADLGIYLRNENNILDLRLRIGATFSGPERMTMAQCPAMFRGVPVEEHEEMPDGSVLFISYIPLRSSDNYLGSIHLFQRLPLGIPANEWQSLVQKATLLGNMLTLHVRNLQLEDHITGHMIRDQWTGLFNRRYMEETLTREFAEASRRGTSIGVVMFTPDQSDDIRHKLDEKALEHYILEVAQLIPRYIRIEDIPCRLSSNVFCVILPGAGLDITMQRAEKMRRELGGLEYAHQTQIVQSSFSVGVSLFPQHSSTVHGLIAMADQAMRSSQRQGGDKVALPPVV